MKTTSRVMASVMALSLLATSSAAATEITLSRQALACAEWQQLNAAITFVPGFIKYGILDAQFKRMHCAFLPPGTEIKIVSYVELPDGSDQDAGYVNIQIRDELSAKWSTRTAVAVEGTLK
jgi:hypothetical protein